MRYVLDTNIVLYLLGGMLAETLPKGEYLVSVITELELLSYPSLTKAEEESISAFLADVQLVNLTPEIRQETIHLRRSRKVKLPDAIIAATTIALGAELLSNDIQLHTIENLSCKALKIK